MSELFPTVTVDGVQYIRLSDYSTAIDKLIATESKLDELTKAHTHAVHSLNHWIGVARACESRLDSAEKLLQRASGRFSDLLENRGNYSTKLGDLIEDIADHFTKDRDVERHAHNFKWLGDVGTCECGARMLPLQPDVLSE